MVVCAGLWLSGAFFVKSTARVVFSGLFAVALLPV
jgi:hypothetical protein